MRFIVLKAEVVEGKLAMFGLAELSQRASGIIPQWIDFKEAKTNCANPEKCDFLSFEDEDVAAELVENIGEANVAYIGVDV